MLYEATFMVIYVEYIFHVYRILIVVIKIMILINIIALTDYGLNLFLTTVKIITQKFYKLDSHLLMIHIHIEKTIKCYRRY